MSSLNEIRHHLRSVEQTRQITNAMYLLSTARMKKAMQHIAYNDFYFGRVRATMKDILDKSARVVAHPYLTAAREGNDIAFIVVAADKGLCGAYNSNVLTLAWQEMQERNAKFVCTAGIMATEFFKRKGVEPDIEWLGIVQDPKLSFAREIANTVVDLYDQKVVDEVYIAFTRFVNSMQQEAKVIRLLPLRMEDFTDVECEFDYDADVLYVPSAQEVFSDLIPQYLVGLIYETLNMSYASEHSARMTAMQNATRNADEMIAQLRSEYNGARQRAITNEITEIIAGTQHRKNGQGSERTQ